MEWETLRVSQEGAELELKGFLFQASDGRWILSTEPNLKSCCVGAAHKASSQVTLQGDFSAYKQQVPLRVRGTVHQENGRYFLSNTTANQQGGFPFWTMGLVCLAIVGIYWARRRYITSARASSSSLKR